MKINFLFTCVLTCVLITIAASSMLGEEFNESVLKQQLHERRVAYRDVLLKNFDLLQRRYLQGLDGIGRVSKAHNALLEAELAIESEAEQRLIKIREFIDQLKKMEHYQESRFKSGAGQEDELYMSMADRIRGEIMLLEEQERQQRR